MIKNYKGSLLDSKADILGHQCNCKGAMGKGVALCIKNAYPSVYGDYRRDYINGLLKLGYVGFSNIEDNRYVANMCGQDNYYSYGEKRMNLTDYEALKKCFKTTVEFMKEKDLKTIAFPYLIGCGLAGGDWSIVYPMIEECFKDFDVELWKL